MLPGLGRPASYASVLEKILLLLNFGTDCMEAETIHKAVVKSVITNAFEFRQWSGHW